MPPSAVSRSLFGRLSWRAARGRALARLLLRLHVLARLEGRRVGQILLPEVGGELDTACRHGGDLQLVHLEGHIPLADAEEAAHTDDESLNAAAVVAQQQ